MPQPNTDLPPFCYPPLDLGTRQFRLLQIKSSLEIELHLVDFDNAPPYYAVSYLWGSDKQEQNLNIDSSRLTIRANLARFIRCYADLSDEEYARAFPDIMQVKRGSCNAYLWIDQICVDQRNIPERNAQVTMMQKIYSKANTVICWPSNSEKEMDLIETALRRYRVNPVEHGIVRKDDKIVISQRRHDAAEKALVGAKYWSRAWIQQELCFATKVRIFSGYESLDWDDFAIDFEKRPYGSWDETQALATIVREKQLRRYCAERELLNTLQQFDHCECSDQRDHLYAFMAFIKPEDRPEVDYGISADMLWWLVVKNAVITKQIAAYAESRTVMPMLDLERLFESKLEGIFNADDEAYRALIRQYVQEFWSAWILDKSLTLEAFEAKHPNPYEQWRDHPENGLSSNRTAVNCLTFVTLGFSMYCCRPMSRLRTLSWWAAWIAYCFRSRSPALEKATASVAAGALTALALDWVYHIFRRQS